ncbi:MAG: class I SAM-dependent methyltransferase [Thermodesulfobacteriota bacterium]
MNPSADFGQTLLNILMVNEGNLPRRFLGEELFPKLLARTLTLPPKIPGHLELLNEINSETTERERLLLYNFLAQVWSGTGDVLEIGPFLGGTTRAMALGMRQNPQRDLGARLYTYDKFEKYYSSEQLLSALDHLFQKGIVPEEAKDRIRKSDNFLEIFQLLHKDQEYYPIIRPRVGVLPSTKDEVGELERVFALDKGQEFEIIFVDGCKGWYPTKYFMQTVAPHTKPGTYFIFQDYGWYTCFWIAAFVNIMSRYFNFITSVDDIYVFKLEKDLAAPEIDVVFPDTAQELGAGFFDALFAGLSERALELEDMNGYFRHQLHRVSSLAYLGVKPEALRILRELFDFPYFKSRENYVAAINSALRVPAYTPEGNVRFH